MEENLMNVMVKQAGFGPTMNKLSDNSLLSPSRRYRNLPIDTSIPLIPIGHFMSNPNHPGRILRKNPLEPSLSKSYGDAIIQKSDHTVRLFFQSVHGLSASLGNDDHRYFLNSLQSLKLDIAGLAETDTCWQHPHLRDEFNTVVRRFHRQNKTVFGLSTKEVDPIPISETFQAGGTITMVLGSLVSCVPCQSIFDPTCLGCWSGVCSGSICSVPLGSSFAQEYNYFHLITRQMVKSRRLFLQDLQH